MGEKRERLLLIRVNGIIAAGGLTGGMTMWGKENTIKSM